MSTKFDTITIYRLIGIHEKVNKFQKIRLIQRILLLDSKLLSRAEMMSCEIFQKQVNFFATLVSFSGIPLFNLCLTE